MRTIVNFTPLQGIGSIENTTQAYISESENIPVWIAKFPIVTSSWKTCFIYPTFSINNGNGLFKLRWRSSGASSGSPFFNIRAWVWNDNTTMSSQSYVVNMSSSGQPFIGNGKINETVFQMLGTNRIVPSSFTLIKVSRVINSGDTLNGIVEMTNLSLEFDCLDVPENQFMWFPFTSLIPENGDAENIETFNISGDSELFAGITQPHDLDTGVIGSVWVPTSFSTPVRILSAVRAGIGADDPTRNVIKVAAKKEDKTYPLENINITYDYSVTNLYFQNPTTRVLRILNNPLTGFISSGDGVLNIKVERLGTDPLDSLSSSYLFGFLVEYKSIKNKCSIPLIAIGSTASTGYAEILVPQNNIIRKWTRFKPNKNSEAYFSFVSPDNISQDLIIKMYFSTTSGSGAALFDFYLANVSGSGEIVHPDLINSFEVSVQSGKISEKVFTTPNVLPNKTILLKLRRRGEEDTDGLSVDLSEVLLEYTPM